MRLPTTHRRPSDHSIPWRSQRRLIDASGLVAFHLLAAGILVSSYPREIRAILLMTVPVVGLDIAYFCFRPKHKPSLDSEKEPVRPESVVSRKSFALEFLVLIAPPLVLMLCLISTLWSHRALTQHELLALVIALPIVVGAVSWIIYLRMTRCHAGVQNAATSFIALAMMATWVGSTFFFFVLLVALVFRVN